MAPAQSKAGEPAKKAPRTSGAASGANLPSANDAAAGAQTPAPIAAPPGPLPIAELLTTGFSNAHRKNVLVIWAGQTKAYVDDKLVKFLKERSSKVSFTVPSQVLLIPPLEIKAAASGANLTSFREVMNHENLMLSFSQSSQYEAAGTVFMCDSVNEADLDSIRPCQLESASAIWSGEAFKLSSSQGRAEKGQSFKRRGNGTCVARLGGARTSDDVVWCHGGGATKEQRRRSLQVVLGKDVGAHQTPSLSRWGKLPSGWSGVL